MGGGSHPLPNYILDILPPSPLYRPLYISAASQARPQRENRIPSHSKQCQWTWLTHRLWAFLRSDCIWAAQPPRRVEHLRSSANSFMRSASFILVSQELRFHSWAPTTDDSRRLQQSLLSASQVKIPSERASDSVPVCTTTVSIHLKISPETLVHSKAPLGFMAYKLRLPFCVAAPEVLFFVSLFR